MDVNGADPQSLRDALLRQLTPPVRAAVETIIARGGSGVYAVGGAVRDLLLGRTVRDLDLVTERNAIDLVRASLTEARITPHARFLTATVKVDGTRIDVATCRTETYPRPGALPRVRPGAIGDDLRRRDFTINAMALRLDGAAALLDPAEGLDDLHVGVVRVLHDGSFRDDATRIFRAFRYAARLGFGIDLATAALIERDKHYVDSLSGERVRREIELLLREDMAASVLHDCDAAGVLRAVHPSLAWDESCRDAFEPPPATAVPRVPFGFALLSRNADATEAAEITARLRLTKDEAAAVAGIASMHGVAATLRRPGAKPSGVVVVLDRFLAASVAAFAATEPDPIAARLALRYLDEWRHERPILDGDDLLGLGIPEGPHVQRGLRLVRAARLDGWASDRDDERALMMRFAKSIRDSSAMNGDIRMDPNDDGR